MAASTESSRASTPSGQEHLTPRGRPRMVRDTNGELRSARLQKDQGGSYSGISAAGEARQHNGNMYNVNCNHYPGKERDSDEKLKKDQQGAVLLRAAAEGQTPRVKRLMQLGAGFDYTDRDSGYTALHHAVLSGFEDTVEALIIEGLDVNAQSTQHGTPLHLAALKGRANVVQVLLRGRAMVHVLGPLVGSALHCAIFSGSIEICLALIEHGADVNRTDHLQYGLMQGISLSATHLGHITIIFDCHPIDVAIDCKNADAVAVLLTKRASVSGACKKWFPPGIHLNGCSVSPDGQLKVLSGVQPAHRAASLRNSEILALLVAEGANIDAEDDHGMTIVMYAAFSGQVACLQVIVNWLASPTTIPQLRGLARGSLFTVSHITKRSKSGYSALFLAVWCGQAECVRVLCDIDSSAATIIRWGTMPLHLACEWDRPAIAMSLLDCGFDVNGRDDSNYTPIMRAACDKRRPINLQTIKKLVQMGALLDATANDGWNLGRHAATDALCTLIRVVLERLYEGGKWLWLLSELTTLVSEDILKIRKRFVKGGEAHRPECAMVREAISSGDCLTAEVLVALGARKCEQVVTIAVRPTDTECTWLYDQPVSPTGLTYPPPRSLFVLAISIATVRGNPELVMAMCSLSLGPKSSMEQIKLAALRQEICAQFFGVVKPSLKASVPDLPTLSSTVMATTTTTTTPRGPADTRQLQRPSALENESR